MIDKAVCDKGFIWNRSNCQCECDKPWDVGDYLENCKYRKKLVDKLVEECTENIDELKITNIILAEYESRRGCSSCTLYIVLFLILFRINVGIGSYFLYFHWHLKKDVTRVKFGTCTEITLWLLNLQNGCR